MSNSSQLTRRAFLNSSVAFGVTASVGASVGAMPAFAQSFGHKNKLAIPALDTGEMIDGVREFNLELQDGITEFFSGYETPTKGINGTYLGPVVRMRQGEMVKLNVSNSLDHESTLHWHGLNLPAKTDGGPHQMIASGQTWSPSFEIREKASTMWYHSHLMEHTAEQVWAGLAGMFIIDDDEADALDLPREYGVDDIPLVLQDRRFRRNGSMPYKASRHDRMAGMHGDYPVMNGTVSAYLDVVTQKVRLRLLNGSNASIYNLVFRDRRTFQQIASDGGLLESPVTLQGLRLAPGERAEIVVDFSDGTPALLESIASPNTGGGMMMGEQSPVLELLEFRPSGDLAASGTVPDVLTTLPTPDESQAVRTRQFVLEMPMGMGMMSGRGGYTINGDEMDMARINHVGKVGETEIWEIVNPSPMAHPFHIHNTQFRILDKSGRAPAPHEAGRKDTVLVEPGTTARILIRFDHYSDPDRPYMYHCHILEHEDGGMMGQFTIV